MMISWMKKLVSYFNLNNTLDDPLIHSHHWVSVGFSGWYRVYRGNFPFTVSEVTAKNYKLVKRIQTKIGKEPGVDYVIEEIDNYVCVECGECQNNTKIYKDELKARAKDKYKVWKEQKKQQELAQKLWEDGCKDGN